MKLQLTKKQQAVLRLIYIIGFWITAVCAVGTILLGLVFPAFALQSACFATLDIVLMFLSDYTIERIEEAEVTE